MQTAHSERPSRLRRRTRLNCAKAAAGAAGGPGAARTPRMVGVANLGCIALSTVCAHGQAACALGFDADSGAVVAIAPSERPVLAFEHLLVQESGRPSLSVLSGGGFLVQHGRPDGRGGLELDPRFYDHYECDAHGRLMLDARECVRLRSGVPPHCKQQVAVEPLIGCGP